MSLLGHRLATIDSVITVPLRGPQPSQDDKTLAPIAHRANVTAADTITSPTCADKLTAGTTTITLGTTALYGGIAAGTAYGTNACGTLSDAFTPTENKSVVMAVTKVDGAEYYDLFLSVDAAPKWVARITEAQRLAGCSVTAVGTVAANATIGTGNVDIRVVGTGAVTTAARFASTVATIAVGKSTISTIDCTGYQRAYVRARLSGGALAATPALTLVPFTLDSDGVSWIPGTPATITTGRGAEQFAIDVDGDPALRIGVASITSGATANVSVVLV
jgi:hypothetical protein